MVVEDNKGQNLNRTPENEAYGKACTQSENKKQS